MQGQDATPGRPQDREVASARGGYAEVLKSFGQCEHGGVHRAQGKINRAARSPCRCSTHRQRSDDVAVAGHHGGVPACGPIRHKASVASESTSSSQTSAWPRAFPDGGRRPSALGQLAFASRLTR